MRVPKPWKEGALPTIPTRRRVRFQSVLPGPILHRLARVLDAIDHDHREVNAVEAAFSQGLDLRGRGPDEVAADARFRDSEAVPCEIDNVGIITSAHAPGHSAKHGLGHGVGGLQSGVGLQRDLAAAVGASHAGTCDGHLLAGQGRRTLSVTVARVGAVGLTLMATPAQPGHLVLQEARGDQHAQFER